MKDIYLSNPMTSLSGIQKYPVLYQNSTIFSTVMNLGISEPFLFTIKPELTKDFKDDSLCKIKSDKADTIKITPIQLIVDELYISFIMWRKQGDPLIIDLSVINI